ncbi:hypothetical protein [Mesorhizobium xinjiangense]|uniref:hypothetical protein n=1 Tax=Mesorhizobium xinjiangense TaxID=2678685 RepID=UPI0012EEDC74|nr:hypothetical protein [Mesorhizobium xinjiangense]
MANAHTTTHNEFASTTIDIPVAPADPRPFHCTVSELIRHHRHVIREIDRICCQADPTDDAYDPNCLPYWDMLLEQDGIALESLIRAPVTSLREARAKADYLLEAGLHANWMNRERWAHFVASLAGRMAETPR